jgi:cyclophilin family peptidyl-prolyl cis-trans isomerase
MHNCSSISHFSSYVRQIPLIHNRYSDICPKACENFINLCCAKKAGYAGTFIHRVVKKGWFQCGDVVDSTGKHSVPAEQGVASIPDESFAVDFGVKQGGMVGYANSGPHTNGSQFFITLGPCDWMTGKFVGIGRVIQGFNVFKDIDKVEVSNQVPDRRLQIASCGMGIDQLTTAQK